MEDQLRAQANTWKPVDINGTYLGSKYELIEKIAQGGMAEIFLARSKGIAGFEKQVVIKRVLPHLAEKPAFVEMLHQEATVGAMLSHPNIIQIFDFGRADDSFYIAMEYVEGRSLSQIMVQSKHLNDRVPIPIMVKIISAAAEGLHYAHTAGDANGKALNLVHRDISPSNILISFGGAVKIADFGIAKASSALHKTQAGVIKGKYSYMSPQQCLGHPLDLRSDIFSLGIVLYEITTYTRLFSRRNEASSINNLLHQPIPYPSSIVENYPEVLEDIVMHCLEREASARYQDARSLHQDLDRYLADSGQTVSAIDLSDQMQQLYPFTPREVEPQIIDHEESYLEALEVSSRYYQVPNPKENWTREFLLMMILLLASSTFIWVGFFWNT